MYVLKINVDIFQIELNFYFLFFQTSMFKFLK